MLYMYRYNLDTCKRRSTLHGTIGVLEILDIATHNSLQYKHIFQKNGSENHYWASLLCYVTLGINGVPTAWFSRWSHGSNTAHLRVVILNKELVSHNK